jgi:hypothetical protein
MGQKQTSDCRLLMSAIPPKAGIGTQSRNVLHCSNNGGLLGQVLPNFRQQFSFDTYFICGISGKIHMATIMKAAVASTNFRIQAAPANRSNRRE